MVDPLKIVKRIVRQPVKECRPKQVYLIREVTSVRGILVNVKSHGHPSEPHGGYCAWLETPSMYTLDVENALKEHRLVRAHIELIDGRWEVLEFDIPVEPAKVSEQDELQLQRLEYEAYANY